MSEVLVLLNIPLGYGFWCSVFFMNGLWIHLVAPLDDSCLLHGNNVYI